MSLTFSVHGMGDSVMYDLLCLRYISLCPDPDCREYLGVMLCFLLCLGIVCSLLAPQLM